MKNKKILSCILSASLLVSMPVNSVFAIDLTWGGSNGQGITSTQENQNPDQEDEDQKTDPGDYGKDDTNPGNSDLEGDPSGDPSKDDGMDDSKYDSKDNPKDDSKDESDASKDDQNGPKDDQNAPDNSDAGGNDPEDQKPDQDENTDSADSPDNPEKDDNGNSGNKDSLSDKNISLGSEENRKNKEVSLLTADYEDVEIEIDGITYTFDLDPDDHTATLTDMSNPAEASEIEIPEQVIYDEDEAEDNEYTVTILRWGPFAGSRQNVSALMIPDTVEKCDVYFSRFSNLTEITIPGSVKKFGGSFQNMNKLETITFEEGVQEISGNSMVSNCSSLENIELPESLKYITGPAAFASAEKLKDISLPDGVEIKKASGLFSDDTSLTSITLPDSVISIPQSAFSGCSALEEVTAKGTITEIGQQAFYEDTALAKIPDLSSVSSMGSSAFYKCRSLKTEVDLSSLQNVPYQAFAYSSIPSVILCDSLDTIGAWAFLGTKLPSVTLPETLKSIGSYAFWRVYPLSGTIKIPDSVTLIDEHAFEYTSIEYLILGSGLESIKSDAFSNIDTLDTVTIRNSSDAVDISKAGFSGDAIITYTEKSISDSVGSAISGEAGAPTLQVAVNEAAASGGIVEVKKDIKLDTCVTIPAGKPIVISSTDPYTILGVKDGVQPECLFEVEEGADVTFDGNLTLSGKYNKICAIKNHGKLTVTGDTTISGTQITTDLSGVLENSGANAKLILSGGKIENNKILNHAAISGTVLVKEGASFEMTGGSIQNNNALDADSLHSSSGVVMYGESSGIMTGGAIQNNTGHRGAAVNIYSDNRDKRAIFTLADDGLITRNTGISANGNEAGGAVFVEDNAEFHMTGGTVSANTASKGGGICIVDSALQRGIAEYGTEFLMDGGVISGNRAGTGGGIYSFSNRSILRRGKIINNTATYSGGGLYSEGRSSDGYSTTHLYNAVVTENTAEQGGGLWFCATGMAELYIKDGIGIFDNKAANTDGKAAGDDLVFSIYGEHSAYTATLAERMLGGGAVKWYRDGTVYNPTPTGYTQISPGSQRYEEGSGAVPLSSDELTGIDTNVSLKAIMTASAEDLAEKEAELLIQGNHARFGGGIGSNGGIEVGEDDTIDVSVKKTWDHVPESGIPYSVTICLLNEGHVIDQVVLNEANGWSYNFEDLPAGYTYSVSEIAIADYTPSISGNQTDGFQIVNTYTPGTPEAPKPDTPSKPSGGNGTHSGGGSHGGGNSGSSVSIVTDIKQEEVGSADIEEREDEEMAIQTLPKTGRSKDYTMFAWLFSGLILLAMVILKRKVK